jgi:hypothetical protein
MFQILRIVRLAFDKCHQFLIIQGSQVLICIHTVFLSSSHDISCNFQRNITNSGNVGVEETATEFLLGDAASETFRGCEDHCVCDFGSLHEDCAETETGEDVHIVALSWRICLSFVFCFREGRTRGKQNAAFRPFNGLLKVTFRFCTRIAQCCKLAISLEDDTENDWVFVKFGHFPDNTFGE